MNTPPESVSAQRRSGYILVAGGLAVLIGGIAYVAYLGAAFPSHLGPVLPAVILILFGYRNISANRSGEAVTDERRQRMMMKAGNIAFWTLCSVIVLDTFLQVSPDEGVRTVYAAIALGAFALGLVLAKYTNDPLSNHG